MSKETLIRNNPIIADFSLKCNSFRTNLKEEKCLNVLTVVGVKKF